MILSQIPPRSMVGLISLALCLHATVLPASAPGQCVRTEDQKVKAFDGQGSDHHGLSMDLCGDMAVVSSPYSNSSSGSVYFYRRQGESWIHQQKLLSSDAIALDYFGWSVSISGDRAVAGSPRADPAGNSSGAAYVYAFDGATFGDEQKLTAADAGADDLFGVSVSIHGEIILISAPHDDDGGSDSGSAYVFRFDGVTWAQEQKLTASDAAPGDEFGIVASLSGDVAVVGALGVDGRAGAAYVYRFDGTSWVEEQKLTASDAAAGDEFGIPSVEGDRILIGSRFDDDAGVNSGSAYAFAFDGTRWTEVQKLTASDAGGDSLFGRSVSLSGDLALVGSMRSGDGVSHFGAAYLFRFTGTDWVEQNKLTASDAEDNDQLGVSVALDGDLALVGAPGDDDTSSNFGSVHAFELSRLAFDIEPGTASVGDTLTLRTCGGVPGSPTALLLTEVNGQPANVLLSSLIGLFDSAGKRVLSGTIPADVQGLDLTFQALALDPVDGIIQSNVDSVSIP